MFDWLLTHTPLFYLVQSFWRDEAFSILTAEKPLLSVIGNLNLEPPLYYVLLHFWIKIFGESEIAARSLSLFGFCLATIVVIFWSKKLFKDHWLSWVVPIFFFFNPMLLYYAFEVRAYGWLLFFSVLSMYAYTQKNVRLLAIANILAFYTHSYALFLPFVEGIHYVFTTYWKHKFVIQHYIKDKTLHSFFITGLVVSPWLFFIASEFKKMRTSWYFPVDLQLVKSVLGNMFTGYDGTPGKLWPYTALLSLVLLIFFSIALLRKQQRNIVSFFLFMVCIPLIIVVGISFKKPLFVNRYLIYVTIAEVILLGYALYAIKNSLLQKILAVFIIFGMFWINNYFPPKKAKFDSRKIILEANKIRTTNDVLYITDPLLFFEAVYYTQDRQHVFLYNPQRTPFPWYVGETAFSSSQMRSELPEYPNRAVLVGIHQPPIISFQMNKVSSIIDSQPASSQDYDQRNK